MNEFRIPVLVGAGQLTQRETDLQVAFAPMDLTAKAALLALADCGPGQQVAGIIDTVVMIRSFADTSWRFACPFGQYANPPRSLAARIGAQQAQRLVYTYAGGNMPQWSVNRLCEMITRGEVGAALIAGGESLATQKAAQRAGLTLDWSEDPGGSYDSWGVAKRGWSDAEDRHGMRGAIYAYPLIENSLRAARGQGIPEHQSAIGQLLARFAKVAAGNPLADRGAGLGAEEIAQVSAGNPYIGFPYTRLMNANAFIDQAAALVVTSVGMAKKLGIARDRWVFLHGCADAHDHWYLQDRRDFHSSPAMQVVFQKALSMASVSLGQIDAFDIYSCFSSAVQVACDALGLAPDDPRGLTVTGGLPYFGGPGNNYVTHAIAQMMQNLREKPGTRGMVTANGNYLTKHSTGIYSTEPPERAFAPQPPEQYQHELDALAHPPFVDLATGPARIETYTVMCERGAPAWAIVYGRLENGSRFIANTEPDSLLLQQMLVSEFVGRQGRVDNDGEKNVFRI